LIRDKEGLTYGVYTYPKVYGTQTMFRLYMQNANNDVLKALELFRRELAEYRKAGPNEMELIKAKGSILNSLLFDYENADKTSTTLLYHKLYRGDASYYQTFVELLSGLDRSKVLETIRKYFPEFYFTAIAGD
jgi:zinc protease